jgi:hypothetical protein
MTIDICIIIGEVYLYAILPVYCIRAMGTGNIYIIS